LLSGCFTIWPHATYQANWLSFFKGRPPVDGIPEYLLRAYRTAAYVNLTGKEHEMIDYAEMLREDAKAQRMQPARGGLHTLKRVGENYYESSMSRRLPISREL
jgi:hypothetical protein